MLAKIYEFGEVIGQMLRDVDKSADLFTISYKFRRDIREFFPAKAHNLLEVGCYRGLTAKALANHFNQYLGLDNNDKYLTIARGLNLFRWNVQFQKVDSYGVADWSHINFSADIIFIDASHYYEHVQKDIENCIQRYPGAIIIFDDYGSWEGVYRAVNEAIKNHRLELLREVGLAKGELGGKFPNQFGSEGVICRIL